MTLPSWRDSSRGGKIRAALWLETEIGEGNVFTKAQLRQAFPDVAQIDRRLRDLRDYGWRIDTYRDDPSLKQEEQRYVKRGAAVWLPGQARTPEHKNSLSAAQRMRVLQEDNHLCRSCGIGSGESYGDGVELSHLHVARRKVRLPDGTRTVQLVTECKRCGAGAGDREVDIGALLNQVAALSPLEQRIFAGWIKEDSRKPSSLEKLWGVYRTLPEESRKAVALALNGGAQ
ncbi:hypothetical protein [Streptomyces sp. YIM 98790]|uniref:hypothetical protein n=1 Tax=Streptomyces sp. YIM 98790 TaxID=2689077 RepID=UPI00140D79B8|nr:hypothetical protein [Streptomyces sp. YIM 98790]